MKDKMFLAVAAAFVEQEEEDTNSTKSCRASEEHDDSTASALLSLRNVAATWNGAQPLYHPGSLPAASITSNSSFSSSSTSSASSSSSPSSSSSSPIIRSVYSGPHIVALQDARGVTPISDDEDDGDSISSNRSSYKKRNSLAMEVQSYLDSRHQEAHCGTVKRLRRTPVMKSRAVMPLTSFTSQPFVGCPLPPAPSLPRLAPGQRLPLAYKPK